MAICFADRELMLKDELSVPKNFKFQTRSRLFGVKNLLNGFMKLSEKNIAVGTGFMFYIFADFRRSVIAALPMENIVGIQTTTLFPKLRRPFA